jgi:hypothetical protein
MPRRDLWIVIPAVLLTLLVGGGITWLLSRQFSGQQAEVESLHRRLSQLEQKQQATDQQLRLLNSDLSFTRDQAVTAQKKVAVLEQSMRFLQAALLQPPVSSRRLSPAPPSNRAASSAGSAPRQATTQNRGGSGSR